MSRAKKSTTDINKGIYEDYKKFENELHQRLGHKNCVCLYGLGQFFEIYSCSEDFMKNFCGILNISYTKRNGSLPLSESNPYMAGFPLCSLEKWVTVLLDNGITIGLVEQYDAYNTNKKTRKLTKVFTPELQIENYAPTSDKYFHVLYLEPTENKRFGFKIFTGLSSLDISTGNNEIQEFSFQSYEEINEKIEELNLSSVKVEVFSKIEVSHKIESAKVIDVALTPAYTDSVLTKVFGGGNTPVQHRLNLTFFDTSIKALTLNLNNIYKVNPDMLKDISEPKYKQFDTKVITNSSFLSDIHILPIKDNSITKSDELFGISAKKSRGTVTSILEIFDKCMTNSGSRAIRKKMLEPTFDVEALTSSYEKINGMLNENLFVKIRENLKNINDPERNLRRLQINVEKSSLVHVKALFDVLVSGDQLLEIVDGNTIFCEMCPVNINEILKRFHQVINLDPSNGDSFIKPNFCEDFDKIVEKSKSVKETVANLQIRFSEIIKAPNSFKIETVGASDDKNFQAKCTSKRAEVIKANKTIVQITDTFQVTPSNLTYKLTTSKKDCIVSGEPLDKLLFEYKHLNNEYEKKQQLALNKFVSELLRDYGNELKIINRFICDLDVYASIAKVSKENAYYCPQIDENMTGFVLTDLRHPIIEINNGSYVANDVDYTDKKPKLCMALNAAGKSAMGRSITTALYLSQCGFFISSNIIFNPFHKLLTRINGDDILTSNLSSFDRELVDLKFVLKQLDDKTFLFADEMSKGSESSAILCMNASLIETVVEKGAFLYLTTHCHEIKKIKEIRYTSRFYFMETEYLDDEIVFKRKFIEGLGERRYGLKCATSIIGKESDFMSKCKKFEKSYVDEVEPETITKSKTSRYNSQVFVECCAICGATGKNNQLESHHILEQCTFDSNKLNGHIKKDNADNLVVLCRPCHNLVNDPTKLIINGWKHTSAGRVLDYQLFD